MAKVKVELQNQEPFSGWKKIGNKVGGANEAGVFGGVYENTTTKQKAMIKQEKDPANNISEFLGSQIFSKISPEQGAKVFLTVPSNLEAKISQEQGLEDDGSNVYVRSEYLKNYSDDLYKDMDKNMSPEDKPSSWFRKDGARPLFVGTRNMLFGTLTTAFKKLNYQGFKEVAPASLLLNDFDMHVGNIGVIRTKDSKDPQLVRIDFAGSLLKLSNKIKPHSFLRHLPLQGPTNHYREFPSSLKNNHEFANSILAASKIDINSTIDKSFKEMSKYYSAKALLGWAKKSMPAKFNYAHIKTLDVDIIKDAFKEVMQNRQESLQEYGLQIKLGLLIQEKDGKFQVNKPELKELIKEYPKYFKKIILQPDILKLRKKVSFIDNLLYKKSILGILGKEITDTYGVVIKEKKANDKIKSTPHSSLEKNKIKDTSPETSQRQQSPSDKEPSTGETVLPIKWEQTPVIKGSPVVIRSTIIKGLNLTLKETTVKPPIHANSVYVSSYRKIEFPLALAASQNDIDLSFAVKEVNGKNMNVKDAKYFTVHYKKGKLMSMSYPEPLEFVSKDSEAIGYVTSADGKIYTVPVTRDAFDKMTKQIKQNQELEQTLAQQSKIIGDELKKTLITRSAQMATNKPKNPLLEQQLEKNQRRK